MKPACVNVAAPGWCLHIKWLLMIKEWMGGYKGVLNCWKQQFCDCLWAEFSPWLEECNLLDVFCCGIWSGPFRDPFSWHFLTTVFAWSKPFSSRTWRRRRCTKCWISHPKTWGSQQKTLKWYCMKFANTQRPRKEANDFIKWLKSAQIDSCWKNEAIQLYCWIPTVAGLPSNGKLQVRSFNRSLAWWL